MISTMNTSLHNVQLSSVVQQTDRYSERPLEQPLLFLWRCDIAAARISVMQSCVVQRFLFRLAASSIHHGACRYPEEAWELTLNISSGRNMWSTIVQHGTAAASQHHHTIHHTKPTPKHRHSIATPALPLARPRKPLAQQHHHPTS